MFDDTADERPHVIKDAKGKRPQFYKPDGVDQLMSMVMVLANEMSVMRDRMDAQERVAKLNGLDLAAGIEKLELDEAALKERETWRQDFLDRLFYLARKEATEAANAETREGFRETIEDIAVN
ncbi:hypothetical protein [Ponticaulis profundi]|uniref:Terminase small subunit n=1 Tax=Ponticaulis profundi TaxID=2665222 RepID=A0ABW1S9Z8_9PROT|tara:strand:- start:480 stop:848 length:369 start_codon:yes stop_codon:yes gene_type:complete